MQSSKDLTDSANRNIWKARMHLLRRDFRRVAEHRAFAGECLISAGNFVEAKRQYQISLKNIGRAISQLERSDRLESFEACMKVANACKLNIRILTDAMPAKIVNA